MNNYFNRYNGHVAPVSCIRFAANEVVSGDRAGRIVVWNSDSQEMLRLLNPHSCTITCLQFDSIRIVSAGSDGLICISDIATGVLLQTLHGHDAKVLDLQFDRSKMLSVSEDGKMRQWVWQARDGDAVNGRRYHILGNAFIITIALCIPSLNLTLTRSWGNIAFTITTISHKCE